MRTLFVLLIFWGGQTANAQDKPSPDELGKTLVNAIVSDDLVAYSQCWVSLRRMSQLQTQIPKEGLQEHHSRRNKAIVESFHKIRKLIDDPKIDKKSLRFKSCKPSGILQVKAHGGEMTRADQFTLLFSVGDDEWRFEIGAGIVDRELWYFTDAPMSLSTGELSLSFLEKKSDNASECYPVTGKVLLDGKPLAGVNVIFIPQNRDSGTYVAAAITNQNGMFSLSTFEANDGAPPGEYTVTIGDSKVLPLPVPARYVNTKSSPLIATVKADKRNQFNFELKTK